MFVFEGFIIGLFGSLHCLGMCGPLVLALPVSYAGNIHRLTGGFLYNLGRAVTYSIFGFIFGYLGRTFQILGLLSWLSVLFGILLILIILVPRITGSASISGKLIPAAGGWLRRIMGNFLQQHKVLPMFIFGLLNGMLPCGLVYGALMGAIITGSLVDSSLYMFLFGLGTLPMMFLLIYFSDLIKNRFLARLRKAVPVFVILLGILFILRGLNLGIPYISPDFEKAGRMMDKPVQEESSGKNMHCH
jgi:hypothetical protein